MANFGEIIKSIRNSKGITQQQMADKLFVTRQSVSNWENNKNLPDIDTVISIAKTFDVSFDLLVREGGNANMAENLNNGKEIKNNKLASNGTIIGFVSLIIGIAGIVLNMIFGSANLDTQGVVHETWFLPLGFVFVILGGIVLVVSAIIKIIKK